MGKGEDRPPLLLQVGNYFVRHWRGELSLAVSFWINGILAYLCIAVIGEFKMDLMRDVDLRTTAAASILLYALSLLVTFWLVIGIWRSASKHAGRGGRKVWASLAKLMVALRLLSLVVYATKYSAPQMAEFLTILIGDKRIASYEIRMLAGGTEVEFYGGIRAGAATALEQTLNTLPRVKVLHINSDGGREHEATQMARLVRERGVITYTSEKCLSAATLVLIAGKERVMDANAAVGFHGGLAGTTTQKRSDNRSFGEAMRAAGISDEFIDRVLATPNDDMWFPSFEEMLRAGVVTGQSSGERFAVSGSRLRRSSPQDLDEDFGNRLGIRAIKEVEPETYQKMQRDVSSAIQSGKPRREVESVVRLVYDQLMAKYSAIASDDTLLAVRDLWIVMLETPKDKDSQAGTDVLSPKTLGPYFDNGRASLEVTKSNNIVLVETVLRGAAIGRIPQVDAEAADKDVAAIRSRLRLIYGDDADLISKPYDRTHHSQRVREMHLAFYRETQKMPRERQCNLLRSLLLQNHWLHGP